MFELTEMARAIANMITIGTIAEADYTKYNSYRVDLGPDNLGMPRLTDWIKAGVARAGDDRKAHPLTVGEQVLMISPAGDLTQAIIICSIDSNLRQIASPKPEIDRTIYSDGTVIEYNRESNALTVNMTKGTMTISCPKITINGDVKLTGALDQTGSHTSSGDQVAGGISQTGHKHAGDGGTGSTADTGAPL